MSLRAGESRLAQLIYLLVTRTVLTFRPSRDYDRDDPWNSSTGLGCKIVRCVVERVLN